MNLEEITPFRIEQLWLEIVPINTAKESLMETWIAIVLTRRKCKRSMEVAKSSQNGTLTCMHPLYIECCLHKGTYYIFLVLLI